ncbi:MAG: hypothetical protein AAGD25_27315 [Cyanobacteria bacterium P01_F01_bin.150]
MKTTTSFTPFFLLGKKASFSLFASVGLMALLGCSSQTVSDEIADMTAEKADGTAPQESIVDDNKAAIAAPVEIASVEIAPVNVKVGLTYGSSRPEVADWNLPTSPGTASTSTVIEVAAVQSTIPNQFQGLWNASLAECSNPNSDGRLLVEADRLRFYDSSGPVTEVIVQSDLEATVSVELSGEGSTWTNVNTLELSGDRNSLTILSDGFESVRYRCPDV